MERTLSGIVVGILAAILVITAFGYWFLQLHRFPDAADFATQESLLAYAASTPEPAIACMLAAWAMGALVGGGVAAWVARSSHGTAALVIGALLTSAVIVQATLIPHAEWVTVVGLLLPLPFAVLGAVLAMPRIQPLVAT
ncbi:MAG: hypothetical protein ABWY01_07390 [Pseudoxanthomonas sp.]